MSPGKNARAVLAIVAAYAVALQTILVAFATPLAGVGAFAAAPICTSSIAGNGQPAPSGSCCDCLATCLTGCAAAAGAAAAQAAVIYAPLPLHRLDGAVAPGPVASSGSNGAHRSRAPPIG